MPLHLASIVSVQATGIDRAGAPHAYTTRLECFQLTRDASAVMESQSSHYIGHMLYLLLLTFLVVLTEGSIFVTLHEGAENPYVKKCTVLVSSPEVSAGMSRQAPSSLFADPNVRCLPVSG